MSEICQRCNKDGDDRRTLWMACLYDMTELNIPFEMQIIPDARERNEFANEKHHFYTLRVCKTCRADWMTYIRNWFNDRNVKELCGSGKSEHTLDAKNYLSSDFL